MALRLYDARTGKLEKWSPSEPPLIHFLWQTGGGPREAAFVGSLQDVLVYLGYVLNQNHGPEDSVDLFVGRDKPATGLWLKPAAGAVPSGEAGHFLALEAHYRKPLDASPAALAAAGERLARLRSIAASVASAGEASPRGLAVYAQRFRERLADDLDFPGALGIVWDGLRPGALSPGSQLALLKEAESALSLSLCPARS